jgi:hypothetical protein
MSEQNANRDKSERRCDAIDLPLGIKQSDLPKYIVYRKEILDKDTGRYREYFYICNHPKLKRWETSKSNKLNIKEKLNLAINKLKSLDNDESEIENSNSDTDSDELNLPPHISIVNIRDSNHFVYDHRNNDIRYNLKMIIKSDDLKKELKIFIDKVNEKYPNLKIENNYNDEINENITENINEDIIDDKKIKLPPNFSLYKEKEKYYIQYSKSINKNRINKKVLLKTNNIQQEFDNLIELLNKSYPEVKIEKYTIPNASNFKIIENQSVESQINNTSIEKPIMPQNFSICNVNSIDYIQFCKLINEKRCQYKVKINSYDLQLELNKFIDSLNNNYSLNLQKCDYIINNHSNWKSTNKIIDHENPTNDQLKNREKAIKSLNRKKELLGEEEFNRQRNEYMRKYNQSKK